MYMYMYMQAYFLQVIFLLLYQQNSQIFDQEEDMTL